MIEANYFTTACCDPSLFNHSFSNLNLSSASDVETMLGLSSGEVTGFSGEEFNTLVPYDLLIIDLNPLASPYSYYDYWGILRDIKELSSTITNHGLTFFSNNVRNIENNSFADLEDSNLTFNSVDSLGVNASDNPFVGVINTEIKILGLNSCSNSAFSGMTNCTIKLGENIKSLNWIGSTTSPDLFNSTTGTTIYMSLDLSLDPYMATSLTAAGTNVTLITY